MSPEQADYFRENDCPPGACLIGPESETCLCGACCRCLGVCYAHWSFTLGVVKTPGLNPDQTKAEPCYRCHWPLGVEDRIIDGTGHRHGDEGRCWQLATFDTSLDTPHEGG